MNKSFERFIKLKTQHDTSDQIRAGTLALQNEVLLDLRYGNPAARALDPISSANTQALQVSVEAHKGNNLIHLAQQEMSQMPKGEVPTTLEEHFDLLKSLAQRTSRMIGSSVTFLTAGQLWAAANYHPTIGYYSGGYGVGRYAESGARLSAFNTPSEMDDDYPKAYANLVSQAFDKLNSKQPFTFEDPFRIFIVGDGEGRILNQTVETMMQKPVLPLNWEIISTDVSGALLSRQELSKPNLPFLRTQFIYHDVRDIDTLLQKYRNPRGVIIAGEELFDDVPGYVLGKEGQGRSIYEYVYDLSASSGAVVKFAQIMTLPESRNYTTDFVSAFPYYEDLFVQLSPEKPNLPLNSGFLEAINGIAGSGFKGYWVGGDYGGSFSPGRELRRGGTVFSIPVHSSGVNKLETALWNVSNVTADVDPGLLGFGINLGLRPEFLGRMGQFVSNFTEGQVKTIPDMMLDINSGVSLLDMDKREALVEEYGRLWNLHCRYGGKRFNWVLSKGEVPPLLNSDSQRFPS
jgi:hypothetical protein